MPTWADVVDFLNKVWPFAVNLATYLLGRSNQKQDDKVRALEDENAQLKELNTIDEKNRALTPEQLAKRLS